MLQTKDRVTGHIVARVIDRMKRETLQGFAVEHAAPGALVFTDDTAAFKETGREHETVTHSVAEYVRYLVSATIHMNGVNSFWQIACAGT